MSNSAKNSFSIGIFDSGLGGISVWKEITNLLSNWHTVYFADQQRVPYGNRPPEEIKTFAMEIVDFLRSQNCKVIVVACNSASAAALSTLRRTFPEINFIGMEPAIKPATRLTSTGVVAVLATQATLDGRLFSDTLDRFASAIKVVKEPCPNLVELIEHGDFHSPDLKNAILEILINCRDRNADVLVLGCTHFPLIKDVIAMTARSLDYSPSIVDPSLSVAKRTAEIVAITEEECSKSDRCQIDIATTSFAQCSGQSPKTTPIQTFFTSGQADIFEKAIAKLIPAHTHYKCLPHSFSPYTNAT